MSTNTSIQPASEPRPPAPTPEAVPEAPRPRTRRDNPALALLKALASLKITVVLFVLSMFLVWAGTMVQMDEGIFTAMDRYFRSFFVWIPCRIFLRFGQVFFGLSPKLTTDATFPFFGGWAIGTALMVNLLAAHSVRFKWKWNRAGIMTLHAGIILMMLGELYTGLNAVEGRMTIRERGPGVNFVEIHDAFELAFIRPNDDDANKEDVVAVPGGRLRKGQIIQLPEELPFNVEVVQFMDNSALQALKRSSIGKYLQRLGDIDTSKALVHVLPESPATIGLGKEAIAVEKPVGTGVDPNNRHDFPSAYVKLIDKDTGKAIGTYLVSTWLSDLPPQKVTVGDKTYEIDLRFKRVYKPYTIHALKVTRVNWPDTDIPREYSSLVRLEDPDRGVSRETLISMNSPLRYQGEAFFQAGMDGKTTVLQVVRNKGWLIPYISCIVVGLGMLVHFLPKLINFLEWRTKA